MTRPTMALGLLFLAGCGSVGPVPLGDLRRGEVVRTTYRVPADTMTPTAHLVRQVNGSIEVTTESSQAPRRINLVDLESLRVARGREVAKGIVIGATAGGAAGILIGMACQSLCPENAQGKRYNAPVLGLSIGLPVGIGVGTAFSPARWVDVRFR